MDDADKADAQASRDGGYPPKSDPYLRWVSARRLLKTIVANIDDFLIEKLLENKKLNKIQKCKREKVIKHTL